MHPVLIDFGSFKLHTYGACMALAAYLCWELVMRLSGRSGSDRKSLDNLIFFLLVGGVVGARIEYVIENWKSIFSAQPEKIIRVDQGGLVFYGGLIVAIVVFFVWCAVKKERPLALADLLCTAIPLGHAIGRIGCFFYGCCWGRLSSSPLAVSFPRHSPVWYDQVCHGLINESSPASLPVLPTQLFEAAALFALFAVLLFVYRRWRRHTAGLYLIGYAVLRFGMECLRGDPRADVHLLSIGQTISLGMAALGAVFIAIGIQRREPACDNR